MKQIRIYRPTAITATWLLFFAAGCSGPSDKTAEIEVKQQEQTVELALKFVPADSTTYKVTLETGKSVQWEGQTPSPKGFQGGHTDTTMEMTFVQQIQSVDDQGNAVAKITIKGLRYLRRVKSNVVLDFDSSRDADSSQSLNNLIGQSYTIEITPSGQVPRVIDASGAIAAAAGDKTAVALLSAEAIRQRHAVPALPAAGENRLLVGNKWSNLKSESFDMMGSKSFERVYTLKAIKDIDGRRIALAQMEAVPSVADARETHKEQGVDYLSKMFDNTQDYKGELKLDLTEGKVAQYSENLTVQWLIVDPNPKTDEPPAALKMGATSIFSIEQTD